MEEPEKYDVWDDGEAERGSGLIPYCLRSSAVSSPVDVEATILSA